MDYDELKHTTVAQLREIAKETGKITGYTQMNKDKLLDVLCDHFGIDHHHHKRVVGINKSAVKAQIRALKGERAAALDSKDLKKHKRVIQEIHQLKRKLRRAAV